jgi:hypothetical protein
VSSGGTNSHAAGDSATAEPHARGGHANASNRIAILYDSTSAVQSEIARLLAQHGPSEIIVQTVELRDNDIVATSSLDAECIVLLSDTRTPELRRLVANNKIPLIVAFLETWPANLERFHACYAIADLVLVADERLWRRLGPLPRTLMLPILDDDTFRSRGAAEERARGVLWFLPPPSEHQSVYEPWIPSPRAFLQGTEFDEIVELPDNAAPEERAEALNRVAIAVCATAGPQSQQNMIEAASCGCSLVVTHRANRAGIVTNGVTGIVVPSEGESMLRGLRTALAERSTLVANMHTAVRNRGWRASGPDVYRSVVGLVDARERALETTDLSDEVTVFISTIGASSLPACLAHLAQQDSRFRLRMVENVAPMSAAFQVMVDTCDTPYYVQVDEDMLLHPDAVRRLHASIRSAQANVALVVAYLYDVHLDAPVQGVKIFRHGVIRRYPFADVQSCELDQIDRMRADGFTYEVMSWDGERRTDEGAEFPFRILGLHGGMYTPRSVYERFRTLEMARRKHPRRFKHQEPWPEMLVERFLECRDPLDFYALMGLVAGALSPSNSGAREKDFRTYSSLPGFDRIISFMHEVEEGGAPT